jgi:hypothetical protein
VRPVLARRLYQLKGRTESDVSGLQGSCATYATFSHA